MLAKRIIPCLDVKNGLVVKGVQFCNHKVVGEVLPLIKRYISEGADEIVFYDITASSEAKIVDRRWINDIAEIVDIPFCVAGGIKSLRDVENILSYGADKISINSPALLNPNLITSIAKYFGSQCVVVGVDSWFNKNTGHYEVYQYTGDISKIHKTRWKTLDWVKKVQDCGAGEIVLNVMNQDGVGLGYDLEQLFIIRQICHVPLIASGGAGSLRHFYDLFSSVDVNGALAASVFHKKIINIKELKLFLKNKGVEIREC
ncbi:imidazole glycerol phosphate synthase subunit HisF [Buchnera aphidicola (Mollitrichosiphum nigrofasciatum)]|uniref:imidazole glycerol phosphate synthase subunit HisF n=1 Tax=Buchnera aphidicola TaxID=9 RepID=UPI0031B85E60